MNTVNLEKSEVNFSLSKKIYEQLIKGNMINRSDYSAQSNQFVSNPLFNELRANFYQYDTQYQMMGMKLKDEESYFYLVSLGAEKATTQQIKAKIYAAAIVIGRYIMHDTGKLYDYLKNINYGASIEEFKEININDSYKHILEKSRIDNIEQAIKLLVERNLIVKTKSNRYVFSDSGVALFRSIIAANS